MQRGFRVVIPVKSTDVGKSRLAVPAELRARLAAAMAIDTVQTVAGEPDVVEVLVVVESAADAERFAGPKVSVLRTEVRGLNAAIADGLRALPDEPAAVLPGDLPGLIGSDLSSALKMASEHLFAVVPDNGGTGTTLLAGSRPDRVLPHYGVDSFDQHVRAGAFALPVPLSSSLRWDVDLLTDLARPVGPATTQVLRAAGLLAPNPLRITG